MVQTLVMFPPPIPSAGALHNLPSPPSHQPPPLRSRYPRPIDNSQHHAKIPEPSPPPTPEPFFTIMQNYKKNCRVYENAQNQCRKSAKIVFFKSAKMVGPWHWKGLDVEVNNLSLQLYNNTLPSTHIKLVRSKYL